MGNRDDVIISWQNSKLAISQAITKAASRLAVRYDGEPTAADRGDSEIIRNLAEAYAKLSEKA